MSSLDTELKAEDWNEVIRRYKELSTRKQERIFRKIRKCSLIWLEMLYFNPGTMIERVIIENKTRFRMILGLR